MHVVDLKQGNVSTQNGRYGKRYFQIVNIVHMCFGVLGESLGGI